MFISDFAQKTFKLENIFHGTLKEAPFKENSFDLITFWDVMIKEGLPSRPSLTLAVLGLALLEEDHYVKILELYFVENIEKS